MPAAVRNMAGILAGILGEDAGHNAPDAGQDAGHDAPGNVPRGNSRTVVRFPPGPRFGPFTSDGFWLCYAASASHLC